MTCTAINTREKKKYIAVARKLVDAKKISFAARKLIRAKISMNEVNKLKKGPVKTVYTPLFLHFYAIIISFIFFAVKMQVQHDQTVL